MMKQTASTLVFSQLTASPSEIFLHAKLPCARSDLSEERFQCENITPIRGIRTAARCAVQPRDWSDINGSGRGTAGTVG
ncbi:hypothetical protein [Paraburkholderia phenoliruptrix]|uniref:hypothetical protein n=1 Tax=Paraburkholderia phenoliruptrix TaxID=252970 RepID=UPI002869B80F|nr:hypothetical protein [Paraburkholderia phenoliruptrix]WMY07288.1 hypothetical protein P3F88_13515 [Paraburkholderia phenoliruptrix]